MSGRESMFEAGGEPTPTNLVLRSPTNWTAVWFLCGLASLHLTVWTVALSRGRADGFMSLFFGVVFLLAGVATYLAHSEIAVLPSRRQVRLRTGYRRFCVERSIAFAEVRGVRLTVASDPDHATGRIELLCAHEDIPCPSTAVARVEALCLALTMNVRLIKVTDGEPTPIRRRRRMWAKAGGELYLK